MCFTSRMANGINYIVFFFFGLCLIFLTSPPGNVNSGMSKVVKMQRRKLEQDKLIQIAKHGLSPKLRMDTVHVVIVGAGIAGLTAGYTLKQAGYKVTLLEASDRAGGRIHTHYADNWYAELGPMKIPEHHDFVNIFVKKFGLSYRVFNLENNNTWYYVNGIKVKKSEADSHPDLLNYETSILEKGKTANQLYKEVTIARDCAEDFDCLHEYDTWSIKEFLKNVGKLSHEALRMIGELLNERGIMHTSAAEHILLQHQLRHDRTFHEIVGGFETLPLNIMRDLRENIIYNARVNEVRQDNTSVTVQYAGNKSGNISGSHVIMATTMTSASCITFEPQLSFQKRDALNNIHYLSLTRIIMVFKSPFWLQENIMGGRTVTDLPIRSICYPSHVNLTGPYPLIVSYTNGNDATKWDSIGDKEIFNIALDNLATIHGQHIRSLYIDIGVVKKWRLDPYSLGGVIFQTPYQIQEYHNAFDTPEGRIHFCGETDIPHGWIDTSIKTAIKVACQIHGDC